MTDHADIVFIPGDSFEVTEAGMTTSNRQPDGTVVTTFNPYVTSRDLLPDWVLEALDHRADPGRKP